MDRTYSTSSKASMLNQNGLVKLDRETLRGLSCGTIGYIGGNMSSRLLEYNHPRA